MSDTLLPQTRTPIFPSSRRIPPAIEDACRLAGSGGDRDAAATEIAARHGHDRGQLEEAVLFWYQRMHRLPSNDFLATDVLRILEAALRHVPRTPSPPG
jgi:hypothetical protein